MFHAKSRSVTAFPEDDERARKRLRVESSTNILGCDARIDGMPSNNCLTSHVAHTRLVEGKSSVDPCMNDFSRFEPASSDSAMSKSLPHANSSADVETVGNFIEPYDAVVPSLDLLIDPFHHLYAYRGTREYDEGMHVYKEAVAVDSLATVSVRSASLSYNMGLKDVSLGKYGDALQRFEHALVVVTSGPRSFEDAPFIVSIHHNVGHCYYRLGRNNEAMKSYRKAFALTQDFKLDDLHAALSLNCIGVLLFQNDLELKNANKIHAIFEQCLVVYRRWKDPNSVEIATVLNNIGRVHYSQSHFDEALKAYNQALDIRRLLLGNSSIDVAVTIFNKGQAHQQLGQLDIAMKCYQDFLDLAPSGLGLSHHENSIIYRSMAEIHHEKGDLESACTFYEKALTAGKEALGNFHSEIAYILSKLGYIHYEMQHLDTALNYYTDGLTVERNILDECHPSIIMTLLNMAQIHQHRGNYAAALIKFGEIHALQVKTSGPNCLAAATSLCNMGLMQYQLKSYSAAFMLYQEALRIQRDCYGSSDNLEVASTLNSIGLVLFNKGAHKLARAFFTESLIMRKSLLGLDHHDVATVWYNIATIDMEMGNTDMAIKLYEESLRVDREALGDNHSDVLATKQHLGWVHQRWGNLEQSLRYFTDALKIERAKSKNQVAVAKMLNLIGNIHLQQANIPQMMECYSEASRIYQNFAEQNLSLVIAGYNFYGFSKLHPPGAPMA